MARAVRGTFDFVRYLQPRFADAPALRARMKRKVLPSWMAWLDRIHTLERTAGSRAPTSGCHGSSLRFPSAGA